MTEAREQRFVFGEAADLYDRARPGYGAAVVDDVLRFAGGEPASLRALEIGAGTGKATLAFADRGLEIVALEPSPGMAEVAIRNCRPFARVRIEAATFEEWPVEAGAFDLVFSAQAWHWVDPSVRCVKAARALRPGGTLALIWHRVHWLGESVRAELDALYQRLAPELRARDPGFPGLGVQSEDEGVAAEIEASGWFGRVVARAHPWSASLTADRLVDRLSTQSDHMLLGEAQRLTLFAAIRDLVAAHGGEVTFPHLTRLFLARREEG